METDPSLNHSEDPEGLGPRNPLSFLREALPGTFRRSAWGFILAWVLLQGVPALLWAFHLRSLAGFSALPTFWGELLRASELWDFWAHGVDGHSALGPWLPWTFIALVAWTLWAGWKHQAEAASVSRSFSAWAWGFTDALLIGLLPLGLMGFLANRALGWLGSTGLEALGWVNLFGSAFVSLAVPATLMLQWWLCRLNRAQVGGGWQLGGWSPLARHLADSFVRLWLNPAQWFLLVAGGVLLRGATQAFSLLLAWRLGGEGLARVWGFILLQLVVAALNAALIAWFLRLVALYWRQDHHVRTEIRNLERAARSGGLS